MNPMSWISFISVMLQVLAMHRVAAPQPQNIDGNNESAGIEPQKQPDSSSPLVMLIYLSVDKYYQTTYTDLETAKKMDLKLPLNNTDPSFVVILCPAAAEGGNENDVFIVRDIVRRIDSSTKYTCERELKPSVRANHTISHYNIGFEYKMTAQQIQMASDERNAADEPLNDLYTEFVKKYVIDTTRNSEVEIYSSIEYDFEHLMPETATYCLVARMRSDDEDVKCHDMKLGIETFIARHADFDFNTFSDEHADYGWRQLIPTRDFKGIYATASTCTFLNHVLIHNDVVENWQRLEIRTRKVADIIDKVFVVNGTYVKTTKMLNAPTIPTLLWKILVHAVPGDKTFIVLIVVHNEKTQRVCDHGVTDQGWGWPEHHYDDGRAGTMYYCRIEGTLIKTLSLPTSQFYDTGEVEPFNLRKVTVNIDVMERIRRMENAVRNPSA